MNTIALDVFTPHDVALLGTSGHAGAPIVLGMVQQARDQLKAKCGSLLCLVCGLPVLAPNGCAFAVALSEGKPHHVGVVCEACTDAGTDGDLCAAAAYSWTCHRAGELLAERGGAVATFVNTVGNA